MKEINDLLQKRIITYEYILKDEKMCKDIDMLYRCILNVLHSGGKLLLCGNGGSAADCQHIVSEFIGRQIIDRRPLPALALCSDNSVLTCLGNDYSYEDIFKRQIEAYGKKNDLLIALSTSGNSDNIIKAIQVAKSLGILTYLITNNNGGQASSISTHTLRIASENAQIVQEITITLFHVLVEVIEHEEIQ